MSLHPEFASIIEDWKKSAVIVSRLQSLALPLTVNESSALRRVKVHRASLAELRTAKLELLGKHADELALVDRAIAVERDQFRTSLRHLSEASA